MLSIYVHLRLFEATVVFLIVFVNNFVVVSGVVDDVNVIVVTLIDVPDHIIISCGQ